MPERKYLFLGERKEMCTPYKKNPFRLKDSFHFAMKGSYFVFKDG